MQNIVKRENLELIIGAIALIISFVLVYMFLPEQRSKVYNCSLAEISPDFPPKVKEECRRIRAPST